MPDRCILWWRVKEPQDEHGQPIAEYERSPEMSCGVNKKLSMEVDTQRAEVQKYFYLVRLPVGTKLDRLDRVEIVARGNDRLDPPLMLNVSGQPRQGVTATNVGCVEAY